MPSRWVGLVYAVVAAVLWGSLGVAFKMGSLLGADKAWLILGRPLLASLASLALILMGRGRPTRWSAAIGLLSLAPLYASYLLAVDRIGAALASILLYTAPVWVVALSPVVAGEGVRPSSALIAVAGVIGATLVSWGGQVRGDPLGIALGLVAGVTYASYMVLARLAQVRGASVEEASLHAIPFAALGVALVARPNSAMNIYDLAFASYLALAGTVVPYFLHVKALRNFKASVVSVVSLVEPLTAVLLAVALLGETLTTVQAVGAAVILASALAASIEGARGSQG